MGTLVSQYTKAKKTTNRLKFRKNMMKVAMNGAAELHNASDNDNSIALKAVLVAGRTEQNTHPADITPNVLGENFIINLPRRELSFIT
jgi:hypothetical protein